VPSSSSAFVKRFYKTKLTNTSSHEAATTAIDAHNLTAIEIVEALPTRGQFDGLPYALWDNILPHDWDRSGNCVYTVLINGVRYRGTDERLVLRLFGFPRAARGHWAHRPSTSQARIMALWSNTASEGFFKMIMWHLLPQAMWLESWAEYITLRRG
jgi:hypothetical protein